MFSKIFLSLILSVVSTLAIDSRPHQAEMRMEKRASPSPAPISNLVTSPQYYNGCPSIPSNSISQVHVSLTAGNNYLLCNYVDGEDQSMAFCTYSQEGLLITSGSDSCPAMSLKTRTKFTYGCYTFCPVKGPSGGYQTLGSYTEELISPTFSQDLIDCQYGIDTSVSCQYSYLDGTYVGGTGNSTADGCPPKSKKSSSCLLPKLLTERNQRNPSAWSPKAHNELW